MEIKYTNDKYYKSDIIGKIIGCAQKVHEAYKVKIGLLINFGAKSLEIRRYIK